MRVDESRFASPKLLWQLRRSSPTGRGLSDALLAPFSVYIRLRISQQQDRQWHDAITNTTAVGIHERLMEAGPKPVI